MFNRNNDTGMKLVIDAATAELLNHQPESEEFKKIVDQLERLKKLSAANGREKINANGVIAVLGNLLGIGMIIKHEQLNVITSKALGFVIKSRV